MSDQLGDTRRSLLNSVDATVTAQRERDALAAILGAVRGLCDGAESENQGFLPVEAVRAAMRPEEKP